MSNLKRYPDYKDSGVPWLGDIPSHWEPKKLKHLARIKNGSDYKHIQTDEGYPVIGSGGAFAYASEYLYDGESVLLGRKGTIDKPLYVNGTFWTVDTMYYTHIFDNTYPKFLYYCALTIDFWKYSTSTALPSMTQTALSNIKFAVPKYEEQKLIVSFLDKKLNHIDTLIGKQKQLLEKLAEQRSAVITHAVTKGLNPDVPTKNSGVEWLGEIPEHWNLKKLKYLCKILTGYTPPTETSSNYCDDGMIWVKPDNLTDLNYIHNSDKKVSNDAVRKGFVVPKGSILVCSIGTIGKIGIAGESLITNQQINSFIFNDLVNSEFSKYLVFSLKERFNYLANQNVVRILNSSSQKEIFTCVPSLDEQKAISNYLDRETDKINKMSKATKNIIGKLKEYRSALITQAVTGKIDVRDMDDQAVKGVA